ncbi:MAG: hypothetical protein NTW87_26495 [Planctomycetota bacterium]|nr:hypothetical protein [Planctomycetota bacterium]
MLRIWAYFIPLFLVETIAAYAAWESFSARRGRFSYRITDIWAMMAGLTPSFLLAAHTVHIVELRVEAYWPAEYMVVLLATLVISQLVGVFIGRLSCRPEAYRESLARLLSATCVVAGATGGLVALVFYILALKILGRPF